MCRSRADGAVDLGGELAPRRVGGGAPCSHLVRPDAPVCLEHRVAPRQRVAVGDVARLGVAPLHVDGGVVEVVESDDVGGAHVLPGRVVGPIRSPCGAVRWIQLPQLEERSAKPRL